MVEGGACSTSIGATSRTSLSAAATTSATAEALAVASRASLAALAAASLATIALVLGVFPPLGVGSVSLFFLSGLGANFLVLFLQYSCLGQWLTVRIVANSRGSTLPFFGASQ